MGPLRVSANVSGQWVAVDRAYGHDLYAQDIVTSKMSPQSCMS